MPVGRPSKYDPSMCEDAKAFMAEGYSKEALAGKLGIGIRTLYDWLEQNSQFSQAVEEGEAASRVWWEDRGREACADGQFNATVWSMNMKNRFGWRDKVDHEVTGKDGGPMETKLIQVVGVDADPSTEEA